MQNKFEQEVWKLFPDAEISGEQAIVKKYGDYNIDILIEYTKSFTVNMRLKNSGGVELISVGFNHAVLSAAVEFAKKELKTKIAMASAAIDLVYTEPTLELLIWELVYLIDNSYAIVRESGSVLLTILGKDISFNKYSDLDKSLIEIKCREPEFMAVSRMNIDYIANIFWGYGLINKTTLELIKNKPSRYR